ncbi:MAG: ABC transporter permease [Deltaproteobacteria bacterium]|jgi:putative ABC transport system permease protein|nr:ABC transporter permease [Deltaproteobacteria bacterium]
MRLEHIVFHHLKRCKGRAAFLVIGLLIGVSTVVTMLSLSDALGRKAQHELENFGANIVITPHNDQLELSYGGIQLGGVNLVSKEISETSLGKIDSIPNRRNVAAIAPKVLGVVQAGGRDVMLMGVDPGVEFNLKRWWSIDGRPVAQGRELVAGALVAQSLGLKLGDQLMIQNQQFEIVGVLSKTGSQDDQLLISPLQTAQNLLTKPGVVSLVEIAALCHDCPVDDMVKQLQTVLPDADVQAVQQVVKTRMHALDQFRLFAWGVAVTVILIGALLVFVTMMGSISERTREIGIYRAIGYRRSHVLRLILVEAGIVSAIAGVSGYLVGVLATVCGLPLLEGGHASWQWDPLLAAGAVIAAIIVGLLAAIQPALRASRLDPSEALRAL